MSCTPADQMSRNHGLLPMLAICCFIITLVATIVLLFIPRTSPTQPGWQQELRDIPQYQVSATVTNVRTSKGIGNTRDVTISYKLHLANPPAISNYSSHRVMVLLNQALAKLPHVKRGDVIKVWRRSDFGETSLSPWPPGVVTVWERGGDGVTGIADIVAAIAITAGLSMLVLLVVDEEIHPDPDHPST